MKRIRRPSDLSPHEEQTVIDTLLYFSDCNVPLTRGEVVEAIQLMVNSLSIERKSKVPFKMTT